MVWAAGLGNYPPSCHGEQTAQELKDSESELTAD